MNVGADVEQMRPMPDYLAVATVLSAQQAALQETPAGGASRNFPPLDESRRS
jgi:hypothetical protein